MEINGVSSSIFEEFDACSCSSKIAWHVQSLGCLTYRFLIRCSPPSQQENDDLEVWGIATNVATDRTIKHMKFTFFGGLHTKGSFVKVCSVVLQPVDVFRSNEGSYEG